MIYTCRVRHRWACSLANCIGLWVVLEQRLYLGYLDLDDTLGVPAPSLSSGGGLASQSISQSDNQSVNQSINQSLNQFSQSINQSVNVLFYVCPQQGDIGPKTLGNQRITQSINQSIHQSINVLFYPTARRYWTENTRKPKNQSTNRSISQSVCYFMFVHSKLI